ncbi:hypothetical protein [Sedimentitalea sp.]|uniref:hypothetical protein n=1 Tax=Sedimentitalea sp. TaxID=2048915 RepID=UPI0032994DEF
MAETCVALTVWSERAGDLQEAIACLKPAEHLGPAGEVYLSWRRVVEWPVSFKTLEWALPTVEPEDRDTERCCREDEDVGTRPTRDGIQAVRFKRGRPRGLSGYFLLPVFSMRE